MLAPQSESAVVNGQSAQRRQPWIVCTVLSFDRSVGFSGAGVSAEAAVGSGDDEFKSAVVFDSKPRAKLRARKQLGTA